MTASGIEVTPENCEQSPTVQAIVNAITLRMVTMPVHVYEKTETLGRTAKGFRARPSARARFSRFR